MNTKAQPQLTLKKIDTGSKSEKAIQEIFLEAFPRSECPPYRLLKRRAAKSPHIDYFGAYIGDAPVGLAYLVCGQDLTYLFFLAVKRQERGRGYGTAIMDILKDRYGGSRFFLAHEPLDKTADNYTQRLARHRFYERCGLKDMPYKIREGVITYAVMGTGGDILPGEYDKLVKIFLGLFRHFSKAELISVR